VIQRGKNRKEHEDAAKAREMAIATRMAKRTVWPKPERKHIARLLGYKVYRGEK
jgi:hypothetical protein